MATTSPKWTATPALRSPLLILGTLGVAAAVAAMHPAIGEAALTGSLVLVIVPCAIVDLRLRIIPNRLTGHGSLAALAIGLALDPGGEPKRLLWAAVAGGFLLIAALAHPAGMGMGDVKLVGMMGLFLGPPVMVALLIALLANVAAAAVIAVRHGVRVARRATLPFGPCLATGAIIAMLAGRPLVHAYLHVHGG